MCERTRHEEAAEEPHSETSGLGGVGSDGDLLPKEFHAGAAGVGSGTGAERDVAQSCDGTRLGDGVQVVPGLGRELADALRCARASPRARRAFEPPKNRGGDTGLATFRLTAPNLRAGLRYDDIKIEQNPDVVKALERIPADELVNRCVAAARASFSESVFSPISRSASLSSNRRLKRAFDIDLKGSWLSPEMQAMQTPFEVRLARPAAFPSVSPLTFAPSQPYLTHEEDEAKQLRQERELLNGPCPWL